MFQSPPFQLSRGPAFVVPFRSWQLTIGVDIFQRGQEGVLHAGYASHEEVIGFLDDLVVEVG